MRVLIGKLNESWEMFRTRSLTKRELARRYLPMLDESTKAALERLKRTFGASGLLPKIRNEYAFHFPPDDAIEASLQHLPDADKWAFFTSDINVNSYYHLSESVVSNAMIRSAGLTDSTAEFERLQDLVVQASKDMRVLLGNCIDAMVSDRITDGSVVLTMEIAQAPKMSDIAIPFYLDESPPTPVS
jgi:hypothetical protein